MTASRRALHRPEPRRTALAILAVLTAINFVNYLDRYVLSAVLEPIKLEMHLHDDASGLLGTVFMVVYMAAAPLGGHLGDRTARNRIAAVGIALWSLATVGSGLAQDYPTLLAMRALVGIGEAGYATVAPAVIADLFRPEERGRKLAIFYLAIPVGSALGYVVGGAVADVWGWRSAFFVAGAPGLVLGIVAWFLPDPPRGVMEQDGDDGPASVGLAVGLGVGLGDALRRVARSKAWRDVTVGMTLMTFAMGGIAFWMPSYLVREHELGVGEANMAFGGVTVVAGFLGTLIGGAMGDRANARRAGGYLRVSGWGLLLGAPLAALLPFAGPPPLVFVVAFFAELLLFLNTGPLNAALVASVPAALRARAVAINVFFIHALGDAISPWLMGIASERTGLGVAIAFTAVPIAAGGLVLLRGATAAESVRTRA